jgi:hypothetical protein
MSPVDFNDFGSYEFRACGPIKTPLAEDSYWTSDSHLEVSMTTREMNILLLLAIEAFSKDSEAHISFQGIKTKLNLHQQKLTIALRRLLKKEMIEKTLNGYKISKKGMHLINNVLKSPKTAFELEPEEYAGLEITIPINNKNNNLFKLVYLLKGRWFASWRWIGMFQNSCSLKMEWQSISGDLEACLCINENRMCIALFDTHSSPSNPDLELLREEFNKFLSKIVQIMDIDLDAQHSVSAAMIKTHSSCNKSEMRDWLTNYA